MAAAPKAAQRSRPVAPQAPSVASSRPPVVSASRCLTKILGPLERGEGIRHGWLGDSGSGKTWANKWLVAEAVRRRLVDVVLVIDDKGPEQQYAGCARVHVEHLRAQPPAEGERDEVIVFRGIAARTGEACEPDDVAAMAFELSLMEGEPKPLVSIDELRRAVSPAGREWRAKEVPRLFTEGRGVGVSITWTTQSPQRIPVEAFDQSETVGLFRCGPRAINYLVRAEVITPQLAELVAGLQNGEFILVEASGAWDGYVYRAPAV